MTDTEKTAVKVLDAMGLALEVICIWTLTAGQIITAA